MNPRKQGDMGMGIAIGWFACAGYTVALPLTDSQHYDLIVDDGNKLQRVSVKTCTRKYSSGSYIVGLRTMGGNKTQSKVRKFDPNKIELLFIACSSGECYLIPASAVTADSTIHLGAKYDQWKVDPVGAGHSLEAS